MDSGLNLSIDADPQQQEAASPHVLVVRSFLRYAMAMRLFFLVSSMAFLLGAPIPSCAEGLLKQDPNGRSLMRLPMAGFLAHAAPSAEERTMSPLMLTFPAGYSDRLAGAPGRTVRAVGLPEDLERLAVDTGSTAADLKGGVFVFDVSAEMGFDPKSKKFSDDDVTDYEDKLRQIGATDVVIRRTIPAGIPVRQITCQLKGRHIFIAYMPLSILGGPVIKVTYKHPHVFRQEDAEAWKQFIDGLAP